MEGSQAPGVIVVDERPVYRLLADADVPWNVQERQPTVAAMWDALSGGRLDQHSRVLVFSDSLQADTSADDIERAQTARAVVAMANAGALVFVTQWRPERWPAFEELVRQAAAAQGVDAAKLTYTVLPTDGGGRALLDAVRPRVEAIVEWPADYPSIADEALRPDAEVSAAREPALPGPISVAALTELGSLEGGTEGPPPTSSPVPPLAPPSVPPAASAGAPLSVSGRPSLPPTGVGVAAPAAGSEYPPNASAELLARPKRPGQLTITVTSSKGGSGKSTASILLAGSIARASADAGHPLSVCVVDLDTRDGQVASLIGKFMPTALNIRVQPVWDEDRIRRNLVRAEGLGVDTLLAPIRPRTADTVGPDFYRTIVRSLQRMYDVVVMDTSVQYLEPLIADVALRESDEILFVTTLASTAVQGMARALREITAPIDESGLGVPREKIGIIVNQSLANVGMERDQVLAAGLGVPVVGVVPLATKDVLTATNLNRMEALLDHPLLGPAYNELARACLPGRELAAWTSTDESTAPTEQDAPVADAAVDVAHRKRGLFRR